MTNSGDLFHPIKWNSDGSMVHIDLPNQVDALIKMEDGNIVLLEGLKKPKLMEFKSVLYWKKHRTNSLGNISKRAR